MALTTAAATALLNHYLNNANHANVGDATGLVASTTDGSLYISLHTSSPGAAGGQTTNECSYTSYARVAISRAGSGFTVSGANGSNAAAVTFPAATGGSETATHFGIGSDSSGAGNLFFFGALDSSFAISSGITPEFAIGEMDLDVSVTP